MKRSRTDEDSKSCSKSNIDYTLTCMICHEILRVPVKPPFECTKCPIRCCFHCIERYLMLELPTRDRIRRYSDSMVKCLLCDKRVDAEDIKYESLEIDLFLMQVLDAIYTDSELDCFYCDSKSFSSQMELYKHVKSECPEAFMTCSWCLEPVKRNAHLNHVSMCPRAEKCVWCNKKILTRTFKTTHKLRCPFRRLRCAVCEVVVPLKDMASHLGTHSLDITASETQVYTRSDLIS